MNKIKLWTLEEDNFLKEHYPDKGPQWCGEKLNRTKSGVMRRANKMGVKSLRQKHKKNEILEAVLKSKNLSEVLKILGLRCAGGNYKTLNKYLNIYEIDTSHFETIEELHKRIGRSNIPTPIEELLIENCPYGRSLVKRRLIAEELLDYKCNKCGNGGTWMGEELVLQLEHKNGVYNDNRIENLEFLCPNCHTQTKTYAGKKLIKKKRVYKKRTAKIKFNTDLTHPKPKKEHICECGNSITESAKQCFTCYSKFRHTTERPPHQQLLKEIEELGYSATGRKYGVSDNAIRKWVEYYDKYEIR